MGDFYQLLYCGSTRSLFFLEHIKKSLNIHIHKTTVAACGGIKGPGPKVASPITLNGFFDVKTIYLDVYCVITNVEKTPHRPAGRFSGLSLLIPVRHSTAIYTHVFHLLYIGIIIIIIAQ